MFHFLWPILLKLTHSFFFYDIEILINSLFCSFALRNDDFKSNECKSNELEKIMHAKRMTTHSSHFKPFERKLYICQLYRASK